MAIIPSSVSYIQEKKKQRFLVWVFGFLVLIVLVLVLKFTGFGGGEIPPEKRMPLIEKPVIDFEVLKSQAIKDLKLFEGIGPTQEQVGRTNPFISY